MVVPVFNEEESLEPLQREIDKVMCTLGMKYEIIYVDDGSTDNSLAVLKSLQEEYPEIRIISFKDNCGQSVALYAGFKHARGEWIVTLDADLQNPPGEIPRLIKFKDEADCVSGIRVDRQDTWLRKISSKVAFFFRKWVLNDTTKDTGCSLRIFKREIIDHIYLFKNFHLFPPFLMREAGFKVKEVEVLHLPRQRGKSKYGIVGRIKEGIFDLMGVVWLKKRRIRYEIKFKS